MRGRITVLAATILAVAASPGWARAAHVAGGGPGPGLVSMAVNGIGGGTPAEQTAAYQRLYAAGVRAVRLDLPWASVQPPGGGRRFDFAATDRMLAPIRAAGLRIIGILDYGNPDYSTLGALAARSPAPGGAPPFGNGNADFFPPDHPADFAAYARQVVRRYAKDAVAWEVWNEENEGYRFWEPHEDPAAYAALLCATYPVVKAVTPEIPVLLGGVFFPGVAGAPGTSGPDFVSGAYAAQPRLGGCYDALAYHPYAYPFTAPELDVPARGSVLSAADQLRAVLTRHGDAGKALWITEVGWPTSAGYGVSEAKQAQYVARMEAATFAQGVPVLSWYTAGDDADPTGANQEAHFGFTRADGTPKPALTALGTFARVFAGAQFAADRSVTLGLPVGTPTAGGRGFALEYRRTDGGATVTALWLANESAAEGQGPLPTGGTTGPASVAVALPVRAAVVTVTDYLGASRTVSAHDGRVRLSVGPGPVYVTDPVPGAGSSGSGGLLPVTRPACGSRRSFVIHLGRGLRGRLLSARVLVNGRPVALLGGAGRSRGGRGPRMARARVDLRHLPPGRFRVRVLLRVRRGSRVVIVRLGRSYRTCVTQGTR